MGPEGFEVIAQEWVTPDLTVHEDIDACGCWMSVHNYNHYAGPYMDLEPHQIKYDVEKWNAVIQGISATNQVKNILHIGNLQDFKANYGVYIGLIVVTIVLFILVRNCKKSKLKMNKGDGSNYGSV